MGHITMQFCETLRYFVAWEKYLSGRTGARAARITRAMTGRHDI